MDNWKIFQGTDREPVPNIGELPAPPSWRRFGRAFDETQFDFVEPPEDLFQKNKERGQSFRIPSSQPEIVDVVNAALYLRRPLLITGKPGTGKTSLAYAVAYQLGLGPVLLWPITARSTIQDGLYRYDAISRLQDAQVVANTTDSSASIDAQSVGQYIQLGPVGTALLPSRRPRVLLIDEIDKSDINLPNDLLNLFEEGEFEIPELARLKKDKSTELQKAEVRTYDTRNRATITNGFVRCYEFPFIVLTSNGERDFPPAFLRRCLRLKIKDPDEKTLMNIVRAHFKDSPDVLEKAEPIVQNFVKRRQKGNIAPDQLLNAIYLVSGQHSPTEDAQTKLIDMLLKYLNSAED